MKILKGEKGHLNQSIKIAKELKEWFTKEAIDNIKIDFHVNNLIIALDKNKVIGFLCYSSEQGVIKILWMGVKREHHGNGIGKLLLNWLFKKAKKIKSKSIEVKTLTEKDNYKHYELTRYFYKKNGFKFLYTEKARKRGWDDQDVLGKKLR